MTGSPSEQPKTNCPNVCSACNGRGGAPKVDIQRAETRWAICDKCGGSGFEGPEEGIYIAPIKGIPFNYQYYKGGKIVANVLLMAFPCVAVNPKTKETLKHITIELHRIWTHQKHRGKGLMTQLMEKIKDGRAIEQLLMMRVQFDGKVRFILSNWQDSTDAGKGFLAKEGFERQKSVLVWDKKAHSPDLWDRSH